MDIFGKVGEEHDIIDQKKEPNDSDRTMLIIMRLYFSMFHLAYWTELKHSCWPIYNFSAH
ncbi:unnamed protein product [Trifolium pratense]|uniref:Uncharacterized protein n=1 Tax=Trifolium pratense TaxID=57577 RepID=A0ACB0MF01_TRIPR|nr:unnamed protein product [Trifolium pratense]